MAVLEIDLGKSRGTFRAPREIAAISMMFEVENRLDLASSDHLDV